MPGGPGADVFVFTPQDGTARDRILDFSIAEDRLEFRGLSGRGDLTWRAVRLGGVLLAAVSGGGHLIRLEGVRAADLDAGDFLFL